MENLYITKPTPCLTNQNEADQSSQNGKQNLHELTLMEGKGFLNPLYLYQGFWCSSRIINNVIAFQNHFQAQDLDIILATKPKSGTTWMKSLLYSIIHRSHLTNSNHPLLHKNPHELVYALEYDYFSNKKDPQVPYLASMASPRLFATHLPYRALPESIKTSKSRIVCMARNPFDTVVSSWKFVTWIKPGILEEITFEGFVDNFCKGVEAFGPHWDHVLGYWRPSLERSNNVLFIKYEDMQENGVDEIKKLAKFIGFGFSLEEEKKGVVEDIFKFCSKGNLKNLEVNKNGSRNPYIANNMFFREGKVGDWVNHLSPSMIEKLEKMIENFAGFGLEFKLRHQE